MMNRRAMGDFELSVLSSIAALRDDAYGRRIRDSVEALRGRNCAVGAVYTALQRLETKGFVSSRMTDPEPVRGGRSKRVYKITAAGARALRDARAAAAKLWAFDLKGSRT